MAQKKMAKSAKSKSTGKAAKKRSSSKTNDPKYVYDFGKKTDGDAKQRELLGGKGANLAEMAKIGLPVLDLRSPRMFVPISTITKELILNA